MIRLGAAARAGWTGGDWPYTKAKGAIAVRRDGRRNGSSHAARIASGTVAYGTCVRSGGTFQPAFFAADGASHVIAQVAAICVSGVTNSAARGGGACP